MDAKATVDSVGAPADGTPPEHYFSESPDVASRPGPVEIVLPDVRLRLTADRGVFSADRLDPGTKLLLLEAPELVRADRTVLDLGCGWGAVACIAARRAPNADVWAVDVNQRALELTARNAHHVGVDVNVAHPDDVPEEIGFDRILSNPPIRIGKTAIRVLLGHWLDRLTPDGRAHMVVKQNLGSDSLGQWLADRGHPVSRLVSRLGYRILEVRPRSDRRTSQ